MSRYDYPDPGLDPDYCDGLGRRQREPEPAAPVITRERTMYDLHKAMHDALTLTVESSRYPELALTARTLLRDIECTIRLREGH